MSDLERDLEVSEWRPTAEIQDFADEMAAQDVPQQRVNLSAAVTHWMFHAGVYPWIAWGGQRGEWQLMLGRPMVPSDPMSKYEWTGTTLYGILMVQLAAVIVGAGDLAMCDWCRSPYLPSRRPRPDRRHFCTPDCAREAHLPIDARYQAKKRRAAHGPSTPIPTPIPANNGE